MDEKAFYENLKEFSELYSILMDHCDDDPNHFRELLEDERRSVSERNKKYDFSLTPFQKDMSRLESIYLDIYEFINEGNNPISTEMPNKYFEKWKRYENEYSHIYDSFNSKSLQDTAWMVDELFGENSEMSEKWKLVMDGMLDLTDYKAKKNSNWPAFVEQTNSRAQSHVQEAVESICAALERIDDNQGYWKDYVREILDLLNDKAFDLEKFLKFKMLEGKILLPRETKIRHQNKNIKSIEIYLDQSVRAYCAVSPAGAFALLRSIIESLLREHFEATGSDLASYINSAKGFTAFERNKMHNLRKDANSVLHDPSILENFLESPAELDAKFFNYWYLIRNLIEKIR